MLDIPGFASRLVMPTDLDYDETRMLWNAMIDRRPLAIALCNTVADVQAAVRWARSTGTPITVRGGGHSIPGHSMIDNGLVIDLRGLNHVEVDADRRTVRVGGGCLLGEVDQETQRHGLATPAGAISHTGAGGLILGGGLGWTMRKYGLTIDNLLAVQLVTAAGDVIEASAEENAELFWALRGGGGNFGVVTEFTLRVHDRGPVWLVANAFEIEDSARVLSAMRDFMPTADDDLVWSAFFRKLPDFPWSPPDRVGTPVLLAPLAWLGDHDVGAKEIGAIMDRLGVTPLATSSGSIAYTELQQLNDELNGHGHLNYHKSGFLSSLDDSTIEILVRQGARITSANSQLEVLSMGGAISRVADGDTAFAHRDALWPVNVCGIWRTDESSELNLAWVRETFDALGPHLRPGSYLNFGGSDAGAIDPTEGYGSHWTRLRRVKTEYDPENFFRSNANIPPFDTIDEASR